VDAAGIPALVEATRHLHGLEATWVESVPVHEQHQGATVWRGGCSRWGIARPGAYAWSHETEGRKRRFHAVIGLFPVDRPTVAVRTAVFSETRPVIVPD